MTFRAPRRRFLRSAVAVSAALPFGGLLAADLAGPLPDVEAVTGEGKEVLLKGGDVRDLAASLRGDLLLSGSPDYDAARRIWNGAFDRHPALIARCTGAADVMKAVEFAAANRLLLSVRGGGHSLSGQSVCEKGLMIDLSQMNGARVDPARRIATIEGGALLGVLDREALAHGLVTTAGTVSHTGVGGLTLGGGFGRLGRRFALACDNVRAVDVVTANGKFARASAQNEADLFWGLRGGGGNFGVATAFEFQLHPIDPVVFGGDIMFSFDDAPAVLNFFIEFARTAPDELNIDAALLRLPNDQRALSMNVCWSGPHAQGEKVLAPLRTFRKPLRDGIGPIPYARLQSADDVHFDHGDRYYFKAGFVQKATPALVDTMIGIIADANLPTLQAVVMPQGGGAIARVKVEDTAFAQRAADHNVFVMTHWQDPALNDAVAQFEKAAWAKLEPHTRGFYVNEFNDDSHRLRDTYGPNYGRLVALKTKVDPGNLFRMNANVAPKARA